MRRLPGMLCLLVAGACSTGDTMTEDECGPNQPCPMGFECRPVDHRCVMSAVTTGVGLSLAIDGNGTVTVSGAPSDCSMASCSFDFTSGTKVTLTAQPKAGSRFVQWGGACSGTTPSVMVTMDAAKSCSAKFVERIAVSAGILGATGAEVTASSFDSGSMCSGAMCTIDKGGSVILTAPTITGSRFTGWSGTGCTGSNPVLTLTAVMAPLTCTASYVAGIGVNGSVVGATGTVTATSGSPGAVCMNGGCSVDPGGTVTLTAPALTGYRFTGWSGDALCVGSALGLAISNVTRSVSCSANYVQRLTVSATISGVSGARPVAVTSTDASAVCTAASSSCIVDARGKAKLEAFPVTGYRFTGWSGGCSGSENPLLLTNLTSDKACVAGYAQQVTVGGTVGGAQAAPVIAMSTDAFKDCSAGSSCTIDRGGSAILIAQAATGFRFAGWSGGGVCNVSSNPLVLSNVMASVTCVAGYLPRVTVTGVSAGATAAVTATSTDAFKDCTAAGGNSCTVDSGGSVTLAVAEVTGVRFAGWTGAGCPASQALTIQLVGVTASTTCTAVFKSRVTASVAATGAQPRTLAVSSDDPSAVCDGTTSCTVDAGATVTFSVGPVDAVRFVGWTGAPCGGGGFGFDAVVQVNADSVCTANYVPFDSSVRPVLVNPWPSPTGWHGVEGESPRMGVQAVGRATYECRSGRTQVAASHPSHVSNQPWVACDGAGGATTVVLGKPVANDPNGSYTTQVRLHIVEYISEEAAHFYYAHDSLDGASRCTPTISDAELYKVVKELTPPGRQGPLPTSLAFLTGEKLANPFLSLPYRNAMYNMLSMPHGPNGDLVPPSPLFQSVLSLRHRFSMSSDRTMLFVTRQYEGRRPFLFNGKSSCANGFKFGWHEIKGVAGCFNNRCDGTEPRKREVEHCEALVLNSAGEGVCVQLDRIGRPRPAIYSQTAWRKLDTGGHGISPKRLETTCNGTQRECDVSLVLPP